MFPSREKTGQGLLIGTISRKKQRWLSALAGSKANFMVGNRGEWVLSLTLSFPIHTPAVSEMSEAL